MRIKLFIVTLFFMAFGVLFASGFRECLTKEQREWLASHPTIMYTGDPNHLPYEAFDEKGFHKGMVSDYLDIIEQKLKIKINRVPSASWLNVVQRSKEYQVDMFSDYTNDKEFQDSHILTKGFIKSPVVIVKQKRDFQPFISDLSELKKESIAVGKAYAFLKPIFEKYPSLNYIEVGTVEDVLKGVSVGKYDTAFVSLNIATYNITRHGLRNLQIVGKSDFDMELGFQIVKENAIFADILNRTFESITQEEHQSISNRWASAEAKKYMHYKYLLMLSAAVAFLILLYFIRSYELKKKIKKSTSELSKLLKTFDEHVIASETDLEGNITYASEAFCKINGYTREEFLGKSHSMIKNPDNEPQVYKELWDTIKAGKVWQGLVKNRRKDGSFYWVDTVITQNYDESGRVSGYMAIRHEATAKIELKEFSVNLEKIVQNRTDELYTLSSQQKAIFDSATIGILLLENRIIKQVNNQACKMFGYTEEELIGGTTRAICESDAVYEKVRDYYEIIREGKIASWEQNIIRKDGTFFIAKVSLKAKDYKNPLVGVVATIDDITLEHKALADMQEAKKIAEESTKAKSQFLANMSHEIRTPMSAIIGMAYLVLETDLSIKQRSYIQKIENAAKNLLGIINDVLDFSKIEAKKMTLEHKEFRLENIFETLLDMFIFKMDEKNLNMLFNIGQNVPSSLIGDSLKLSQVLINLVSNAVKFTSSGEIIISVKVAKIKKESVRLEFEVKDSGIGLSKEQIKGLFTPFHQADGSITRTYGGTGLGLSISKYLVEMMGGTIGVESEMGMGSRFYFSVKMDLSDKNKTILKHNMPRKLSSSSNLHTGGKYSDYENIANSIGGAKILLVEDNVQNQEIATELLNKVGIEVVVANNGKEALEKIDERDFDGVLMDCQMPVMDGYEATRVIREKKGFQTIPIIAMTANNTQSDKEQCFNAGMNDFVAKPIDVKNFYNVLMKWITPKIPTNVLKADLKNDMKIGIDKLKIYGVSLDKALLRVAKDEKILFGMLKRFSSSQKDGMSEVSQALKNERLQDAKREVHTLKGLCGNIEAVSLFESLQKLECELNTEILNRDLVESMITNIDEELQKVVDSINENLIIFDKSLEINHEKKVIDVDSQELKREFYILSDFFKNFDSEAIESAQNLAFNLRDFVPKEEIEHMLKASSSFDFEEANRILQKLAKDFGIDDL
ncbi:MAG: PAS domain S-box protein [Sulfurimonas sp.]|jgi:PAS domain S-box-containing protein|uniref:PAS domain S-box protein n=1 Tax=Sulfurimonas sp. TaxID=2022749 RepID=UPI003563367A